MQSKEELATAYKRVCQFYGRGTWRIGPPRPLKLRITTLDGPEQMTLGGLEKVIDYSREQLGVEFDLIGGGVGCFDLVLGAHEGRAEEIEEAIERDEQFQALLNGLNAHIVRLRSPTGTSSYAAYSWIKAGLITNRCPNLSDPQPIYPAEAFSSELSDEVSFGIVEFQVLDFQSGQSRPSLMRRVWSKVRLGLGDVSSKRFDAEATRIDIIDKERFNELLVDADFQSLTMAIHGFANGFAEALESFSRLIYNTGLDRLGHFPVLFSWPASPNPTTYLPQSNVAKNSRKSLAQAVELLCDAAQDRPVNTLAHSHGNDMLVEVARDRANAKSQPPLHRAVLVEPDIDAQYLSGEIELLSRAASGMTLYHSSNDVALALSRALFGASRAGQTGVEVSNDMASIEVIDASNVARGLMKHSPHVDVAEVIYDIRDVLEGRSAQQRGLISGATHGAWKVKPLL